MPLSMNLFLSALFLLVMLLGLGVVYLRAVLGHLEASVATLLEKASQPPLEVLVARAYDYAVSKAPPNDLALRRTMAAAVTLFDVGGDGKRDFTDAQVAVAVDAFVQRAKGV